MSDGTACFRQGQIVAVRHQERDMWTPAVFIKRAVNPDNEPRFKCRRLGRSTCAVLWEFCLPAQEVWPWLEKYCVRIVSEKREDYGNRI